MTSWNHEKSHDINWNYEIKSHNYNKRWKSKKNKNDKSHNHDINHDMKYQNYESDDYDKSKLWDKKFFF